MKISTNERTKIYGCSNTCKHYLMEKKKVLEIKMGKMPIKIKRRLEAAWGDFNASHWYPKSPKY